MNATPKKRVNNNSTNKNEYINDSNGKQFVAQVKAEIRSTKTGLIILVVPVLLVTILLSSKAASWVLSSQLNSYPLLNSDSFSSSTLLGGILRQQQEGDDDDDDDDEMESLDNFDAEANARQIKEWRKSVRDSCASAKTVDDVLAIDVLNTKGFDFTNADQILLKNKNDKKISSSTSSVIRCSHVVLDLGANIGDTSGHVIDSGMISCDRKNDLGVNAITKPVHYNVTSTIPGGKRFEYVKNRNSLTRHLVTLMSSQQQQQNQSQHSNNDDNDLGPEDYCYYGVEGNPTFTKRLTDIEQYTMAIRPRPIRHLHFFTESVGAGVDGPTKLYLDTVNTDHNFWGSSIFANHQDVRKSMDQNNGNITAIAADVMGYTIGTLMKQTLLAFDDNNNNNKKKQTKNHLILKVDIEGGEYPLLDEAVREGTLCRFVKDMGHTADLFIEFHSQRVTGKHDYASKTKSMKETLTACGVTFRNLQAWWA